MSIPINVRLTRLADQLGDLRMRLKQAARFEVAQAIADALAETTRALICGPTHVRSASHGQQSPWDDPWRDPYDGDPFWANPPATNPSPPSAASFGSYQTALMTGLAVGRWSFTHTGQPAAALGLAGLATIVMLVAGGKFAPLLDVCTVAHDLLAFPNRRL